MIISGVILSTHNMYTKDKLKKVVYSGHKKIYDYIAAQIIDRIKRKQKQ